ncbi:MAG: alpha/beta hydrolase [Rhizobiaceae bacterium]|nr:alpha/beta hydrolase [Rhizobiaceae bacterium]
MPELLLDDARIHYEEYGSGYPVVLFAPGFLNSRIERWRRNPAKPDTPQDFADPIEALADRFRLITLDIRNAGASRGAIGPNDSWDTYVSDFTKLVDHLGVTKAHVMGGCIGVSFAFALGQARPGFVSAYVLQNPVGFYENRAAIDEEADRWADLVRTYPEVDQAQVGPFRQRLFAGDFLFAVSREFVSTCKEPILLMPGNDTMHPKHVSDEIIRLAPQTEAIAPWKGQDLKASVIAQVKDFLIRQTPSS